MTTKITVATAAAPVDVTTSETYSSTRAMYVETITVEPNSEADFYISECKSVQLCEVPLPALDENTPAA